MPFNLIKEYNSLLEIDHLDERQRRASLLGIFNRDIRENPAFIFLTKKINPPPCDAVAMDVLFDHLTKVETDKVTKHRDFDPHRSKRLHWIKFHIEKRKGDNVNIFSIEEVSGIRTYIHDLDEKYVIILEPYRNYLEYYLITAYLLRGREHKKILNKYKRRLPTIF